MQYSNVKLSITEKKIIETYKVFAKGLADYLGESCEVILHSLEDLDHSVIEIIHGYHSGRSIGAPITDLALAFLENNQKNSDRHFLTYFSKSKTGQPLKSCTISIQGDKNRIIGLLCINYYLNTPFFSVINSFLPQPGIETAKTFTENYVENSDDLIRASVEMAKEKVFNDSSITVANRNKEIINFLYEKGIFNLKDAVVKIAAILSISKNTVYMHIRNRPRK
ncbi:YheO-like PAS domain protein [Caprobacter fermentans]|uniref:PAS domain-containing protein n=1 Tax=Caproicibacter fermentans TaxID=2576756 RepID=A0A6N8HWK7_9FIRM|nr:PAS domain-containing protein [Caproicibacter fermentans]MVB10186.1 YheO-like PAS domain protein [Caproicibacter fermentans]OCN00831.1 hypothetical protein A7X67_08675 [Clostridium sp. W14A]QNK41775.1 PAS domain-containing protein [Caproicibacter fermentans]